MSNRDRRQGRREEGVARRKARREYFEGDVIPETHHAFARPDVHEVLSDFGYWLNDFDSDFSTYVKRGGKDFIETCRLDGSWRHVVPGEGETNRRGGEDLRTHFLKEESRIHRSATSPEPEPLGSCTPDTT
jgi:hypothetical protein